MPVTILKLRNDLTAILFHGDGTPDIAIVILKIRKLKNLITELKSSENKYNFIALRVIMLNVRKLIYTRF